jgi:DNA-directed RNA polymerase subunit RPC12/RpoP
MVEIGVICIMNFVPVQFYQNYIDAHIVKGRLEEAGIECWLKDEHTVTTNPIWTNAIGGIKLMVPAEQHVVALALLQGFEAERKSSLACKNCGSHNIELVSTPRKARNWLAALVSFFFGDYAIAPDKVYHCFDCNHENPKANSINAELN